jgi:predicted nucleic acid-binding protein
VVEVHRVAMRQTEVDASEAVEAVLAGIEMIELDDPIARAAAEMAPRTLRSLDAIHLASALALGDELGAFVTYDGRLADAARSAGLPVIAPS